MKISKKILSYILSAVFILGTVFAGGGSFPGFVLKADAENIGEYSLNDIIEFGWYPQTKVVDENIIAELNADSGKWISYEYMSGTGEVADGKMVSSDYMKYKDVVIGSDKYRGVTFDSYRPFFVGDLPENNRQEANGYFTDTVYWFKYEPVKWRVLDPLSGMVIAESILDSQPFNDFIIQSSLDIYGLKFDAYNQEIFWGDSEVKIFCNDYAFSSIRKWLNEDFYTTAFSYEQRKLIKTDYVDNTAYREQYDCRTTSDSIFLLSYIDDIYNTGYGFSDDTSRKAYGTDYARCQGLYAADDGASYWYLRTPGDTTYCACYAGPSGSTWYGKPTDGTDVGIRPAFKFKSGSDIFQCDAAATGRGSENNQNDKLRIDEYITDDIIEFGWYPQSLETNELVISVLNSIAGDTSVWNSYNYFSSSDDSSDGKPSQGDFMRYKDVVVGSAKYRGVFFDNYRPCATGWPCSAEYSNQVDNGYLSGCVYWFKYEPIKWRVLDSSSGMIMSEKILDSQPFNNYAFNYGTDEYGNSACWGDYSKTYYANNYEKSNIREWLNDDFYNMSFSPEQKNIIKETVLDNRAASEYFSAYDAASTKDKIYLLSYHDVNNPDYGFPDSVGGSIKRTASGTDYARCQGLYISYSHDSNWILRSASMFSDLVGDVGFDGSTLIDTCYWYTSQTDGGIRPVLNLDSKSVLFQSDVTEIENEKPEFDNSISDPAGVILKWNEGTFDDDIKLVVESKPEQFNTSFKLGGDYERNIYDIYVVDGNGNRVQPRNGRLFELEMTVDESLNGKKVFILHYLENGKKEKLQNLNPESKVVNSRVKITVNHFSEFVVYEVPDIGIENFKSSFSADYKSKLTFNANITDVGENNIHWFVNGKDVQTGSAYTIDSAVEKEYEVQIKVIVDGETISESEVETVNVKTNFFAKLIAFFRGLFGKLPEYVDNFKVK